jgi:acetyltransferase-like isoleucine patch superfamily enzyme/dTDP-4-dehydrorhamnose 3,5-epimerase-like enzyme
MRTKCDFFKHDLAVVESSSVGARTRIWAFSHILPGAVIGADCNICDHTFIENDVIVGDRVTIKCGVQLWDGITVEDDVFIGPNATFTNDPFPRSRRHLSPNKLLRTTVKTGASVGANATILPGITIGERAMIGAGAVVINDVPCDAIVVGNPARIVGYSGVIEEMPDFNELPDETGVQQTLVQSVTLHRLPRIADMRGMLSFAELDGSIPFEVRRYFLVYGVPTREVRGSHAHKTLHQFLICVHGSCHVIADDGETKQEFVLDDPSLGLHVPPGVWSTQYKHSAEAVLLVLASDRYDAEDYVRNYSDFLQHRFELVAR